MGAGREARLTARLLQEAREELVRADGKASLLLAAASVVAVGVLAAILAGDWRPSTLQPGLQVLWWIGTALGLAAIVSLAVSVYPRTIPHHKRSSALVAYFGDVVGLTASQLAERIAASAASDAPAVDQVLAISVIVHRKYRGVRLGMWMFAFAALLCIGAVVINRATS